MCEDLGDFLHEGPLRGSIPWAKLIDELVAGILSLIHYIECNFPAYQRHRGFLQEEVALILRQYVYVKKFAEGVSDSPPPRPPFPANGYSARIGPSYISEKERSISQIYAKVSCRRGFRRPNCKLACCDREKRLGLRLWRHAMQRRTVAKYMKKQTEFIFVGIKNAQKPRIETPSE